MYSTFSLLITIQKLLLETTIIKNQNNIPIQADFIFLKHGKNLRCSSPLLFAFLLLTAICKASSDSHFAFLNLFFLGMVLIPVSCTVSQTSTLSSSGTLSIRSNPLKSISHFYCIIVRDLIQVIPEWYSGFPYFLQFKSEFGNKEFMI